MQMPEVAEQAMNLWPAGVDSAAAAAVALVSVAAAALVSVAAAAAAVSEQARWERQSRFDEHDAAWVMGLGVVLALSFG